MPSTMLSSPDYVVLGMVGLGQRSGYEIKQAVELSIRFFWTISPAQSIPASRGSSELNCCTAATSRWGGGDGDSDELTTAGQGVLTQWLRSSQPIPFELRDLGMVKLFFADTLTPAEASGLLTAVRQRSEQQLAGLRAIEPEARAAERRDKAYPPLTLELGIAFHQAMVDVCERFERRPH